MLTCERSMIGFYRNLLCRMKMAVLQCVCVDEYLSTVFCQRMLGTEDTDTVYECSNISNEFSYEYSTMIFD